ncbi:MAG: hypothetical protein WBD40_01290 [Tepidisphaeraceae bacterium]
MPIPRRTVIFLTLLLAATVARAEAAVGVEVGWGNTYRAGRWNPIYVTAESSSPREVIAVVEGVTGAPRTMTIRNRFALSPSASTHAVFFPLGELPDLRDTVLTLRDPATFKRIAGMKLNLTPPVQQAPLGQPMIGVSGDGSTSGLIKDQFAGDATVGYVTPAYLPVVAAGYDALDVLMLNAPDFSGIREDQQQAIVDWLRAGGTLVLWPGSSAPSERGPLIDVLPALIGESYFLDLDPATVERIGWTRVPRVRARQLNPLPDAEAVPLVGQSVVAYRRPVGFGQVVISPIDLSAMRFTVPQAVMAFWKPLLHGVPDRTRDGTPDVKTTRWLRDMPNARARTIPAWLLVSLAFLGPVDTLLLKLLGRRPWTFVTVLGWGGLIAAGAFNISRQNAERTVEYRSVRMIEEADGAAAIVTDLVSLRWPEGTPFDFQADGARRGAWWQPANDPTDPPESERSEFHAEQSEGGTWPTRFAAHVPTPRVLQAQEWTSSPSIVVASLTIKTIDGKRHVVGALTNRGEKPLANVRIRLADGIARLDGTPVASGESRDVRAPIDPDDRSLDMPPAEVLYNERRAATQPVGAPDFTSIESFAFQRSLRLIDLLAKGDRACIYAEIVDPAPPVDLPAATRQKHLALVRSLVRLDFKVPETPATRRTAR